jgi:uncharacterized membrane protein
MNKARVEAFSDGVIAILITIMVLELKVPHGTDLRSLAPMLPTLLTYLLSFVYLGIYWTNHHHLFHATHRITGGVLWANLHLLFWLSMVPFVTGWMGENHFESLPTAGYGVVMLFAAMAYLVLTKVIIANEGRDSTLAVALGKDVKGKISALLYLAAIPLAFVQRYIADAIYVLVAAIWLIPDRRIEKLLASGHHPQAGAHT